MDENLKKLKMDLDAEIRRMDSLDDISREKLDKLLNYVEIKLRKPSDPCQPRSSHRTS